MTQPSEYVVLCESCLYQRRPLHLVGHARTFGWTVMGESCHDCGEHCSVHAHRKGRLTPRALLADYPKRETQVVNWPPWLDECGPECPLDEPHIHKLTGAPTEVCLRAIRKPSAR